MLANPLFLRAAVVFSCATISFLVGIFLIRRLRHSLDEESATSFEPTPSLQGLPLHLYNSVIQQLKQQKQELQDEAQAEQRRARESESFSQAVLANLSCGVVMFGTDGLVKQSNPAARGILGFASPNGLKATDIFRAAVAENWGRRACGLNGSGSSEDMANDSLLAEQTECAILDGEARRGLESDYTSPSGERRRISVTLSPVASTEGKLLGAACLITDIRELDQQPRKTPGGVPAEAGLALRNSVTAISSCARRLAINYDPQSAKQLAADISAEAERLSAALGQLLSKGLLSNETEREAAGLGVGAND